MKKPRKNTIPEISSFDFKPGHILAKKYKVLELLGSGWEGEVYKVCELHTKIERAAKIFFPQRNQKNRTSNVYAKKLHKLYHSPIIIQYHAQEEIVFQKTPVTVLISELVEGDLLPVFLRKLPRKRLSPFQAIHFLHALSRGLQSVHLEGEYHGDLHAENIIVTHYGLHFELKLLDMFYHNRKKTEHMQDDICSAIQIFQQILGGAKHYGKQPPEVKFICCGLKRSLILKKFPRIGLLVKHLETLQWDSR